MSNTVSGFDAPRLVRGIGQEQDKIHITGAFLSQICEIWRRAFWPGLQEQYPGKAWDEVMVEREDAGMGNDQERRLLVLLQRMMKAIDESEHAVVCAYLDRGKIACDDNSASIPGVGADDFTCAKGIAAAQLTGGVNVEMWFRELKRWDAWKARWRAQQST